jgi:hypothetical protein
MPGFVYLLACERVIEGTDHMMSFINLLDGFLIPLAPGTPANSVVRYKWYIVNLWRQLPEDEGRKYVQRVDLVQPDGNVIGNVEMNFEVKAHGARCIVQLDLFPVGKAGTLLLRLHVRQENDAEWREVAAYPIRVIHTSLAAPPGSDVAGPLTPTSPEPPS